MEPKAHPKDFAGRKICFHFGNFHSVTSLSGSSRCWRIMIRSQHKESRQCDTTGERGFQKTEPISEGLAPASRRNFTRIAIVLPSRAARTVGSPRAQECCGQA
jgi:hypothetical protein